MANLKIKDENGKWVGIPSIQGEPGPAGPPGKDGAVTFEELTEEQVESLRGPKGEPGTDGKDGITPTFEIGTVTTGEANVEMTEENNHYTLDFTFPEGGSGGSTIRYIDLDALSSSNPLILENLELGVYALTSSSSFASLYIKAKASNTKALKVDYATHGLRILNYHYPISNATNGRNVVMLSPSDNEPQYNRILTAYSSETSGLNTSRVGIQLVPESYVGVHIPALASGKTNTYASDNVFNKLPTSSATPSEDNHLVNKKYVDNLVSSSGGGGGGEVNPQDLINVFYPVGSYYETSDTSFNPNTSWGGTWVLEEDGTVLVSKSNVEGSKFNSALGTVLGEEEHLLTKEELPKIDITLQYAFPSTSAGNGTGLQCASMAGASENVLSYNTNFGETPLHNNIQPSKIVNRWHRTA